MKVIDITVLEFPQDGYLIIKPDGHIERVELAEELPLVTAQKLLDGFVQIAPMADDRIQVMVDEEGLLKDLDFNPIASTIADQPLVGTALAVCGKARWL